jgi:hypothetical protein
MSNDIAILGQPGSLRPALLDFDGTVCTGSYKLVQRVLTVLFTDESNEYSFGIGTEIPQILSGSNAVEDDILQNLFNIAGAQIKDIFDQEDITGVPDDEILQDIRFAVIQPEGQLPDTRTIEVAVYTQAGEETVVEVPIKFEEAYG